MTKNEVESALIERLTAERDRAREECGHEKAMRASQREEMMRYFGDWQAAKDRIEALWVLLDSEPLIVSGIRRDAERTPSGRGGELCSIPATPGYGKSGCPGDNLTSWIDSLRAALIGPA